MNTTLSLKQELTLRVLKTQRDHENKIIDDLTHHLQMNKITKEAYSAAIGANELFCEIANNGAFYEKELKQRFGNQY